MICPNCKKIVAQDSAECPFCKIQFYSQPTQQGTANAPVSPQYVQAPYAPYQQPYGVPIQPPPLTPEQTYHILGGFLQFITVIWHYILPISSALVVLYSGIQGVKLITEIGADNYTFETLKPALQYFWLCIASVVEAVFYCIVAVKIERRDSGFLRLWQIILLILLPFSIMGRVVLGSALSAVLIGACNLISFAVLQIYFTSSLRVRIYMGSEDYLHKALFHKVLLKLKPNVDKRTKTKNALIAAALLLVYYMLAGINVYYTLKPVMKQLRTQMETVQQAQVSEYTDALTGATFTIPKGLKENKKIVDTRYSLVLESAHNNFELCAFASRDMLGEMDEADKQGISRADINNEMFTRKEIEDLLTEEAPDSISEIKTTVERIGKYEYYVVSFWQNDINSFTGEVVNFVHYYNGYEYVFHYETPFDQFFSMNAVKEWIASTTIPGEAALPEVKNK